MLTSFLFPRFDRTTSCLPFCKGMSYSTLILLRVLALIQGPPGLKPNLKRYKITEKAGKNDVFRDNLGNILRNFLISVNQKDENTEAHMHLFFL